jgi:enoyl-CoA hydratase/carnithine racemase
VFEYLGRIGSQVRAIVFTGAGKNFTAGIDLFSAPTDLIKVREKAAVSDPGRAAVMFQPIA